MNYFSSLRRNKNLAPTLAAIFLSVFSQSSSAESCPAVETDVVIGEIETIEFAKSHSDTLLSTLSILSRDHYENLPIDDELSQAWFDGFLDFLDPGRSYLLASDIAEFTELYANQLDDLSRKGDLTPAKVIYERFRQRTLSRLESNIAMLEDKDFSFDYSSEQSLPIDREEYDWPVSEAAADQLWLQQLTLSLLNLKLSSKPEDESRDQLVQRYSTQLASVRSQKTRQVADLYLNALGHIYDPHTDYFSPRDSETFEITMSLSLEGIGAVLQREDEFTEVVSVVPGGPAQLQGELQAADRIVAIGEGEECEFVDVVGWQLDDVVDRIRGPKDSIVRLQVIPADADDLSEERKVIHIVRDRVKLEDNAAKGEVIEIENHGNQYSLGVIDVPSFYLDIEAMRNRDEDFRSTTRDVQNILDDFTEAGVDGVIVDLRQNGGGSLLEAATLTDLFVDPGPVVQIKDQSNRIFRNHRARTQAYYDGPLVVLIDRLSASASEIFAGAIQDYSRGLIIGSQSFGKGTVQSVQPLPEGQLKLTESKFYRISGDSTQHKGVIPDINLPDIYNPEDIGESAYENALGWDQIRGIPHRKYQDFSAFIQPLETMHKNRLSEDADMRYLLETIAIAEERRSQTEISLNEALRIEDREHWEAREESVLGAWRSAKGIVVPEEDEEDEQAEASEENNEEAIASEDGEEQVTEPDVAEAILYESGRVFSDLLHLMGIDSVSSANKITSQNGT